jgi:hypothetical protein
VTRVQFGSGKSNGVALARWARMRVPCGKVLFVARPEFQEYAEGFGTFMPYPVSVAEVAGAVPRILSSDEII